MYILVPKDAPLRYPYSPTDLRRDHPGTSFPETITNELLLEWDVHPVLPSPRPAYDYRQNLRELEPVLAADGWTQVWSVVPASDAEIQSRLAEQWESVRDDRNLRLSTCDWTQLADANVDTAAWASYRQALRDLPQTQTNPFAIVWPTPPSL